MELITIPRTIPISIEKLINYISINFKIQININEDFLKNILDEEEYSYDLYKSGKNKNNVKIIKRKQKCQNIQVNNNKNIYIEKCKYINKEKHEDISKNYDIQKSLETLESKKQDRNNFKYTTEKMFYSKDIPDLKKIYNLFLIEKYNYQVLSNSFLGLLDNHQNICNLFKNMKFKLDNLYETLHKYKKGNNRVDIPLVEYEILLKKISKIIPTNNFINML